MWGLTADGSFVRDSTTNSLVNIIKLKLGMESLDVYHTVLSDVNKTRNAVSLELQRFQYAVTADSARGNRLLFLFQRDLMPGINSMILESKGNRDSVLSANVEVYQKWLAWFFILILNASLLFYIYLFAISQSVTRQTAWFQTFVIWLVLEIVAVSTIVVYVTHFLIPTLVMRDLGRVKRRLLKTIQTYKKSIRNHESDVNEEQEKENAMFNVADYFFVSKRVSMMYPELRESKIIKKFISPWPHQSYRRTRTISKTYSKRFSTLFRSASMILVFFLKGFLTLPPGFQDAFMSMVTVLVSGNAVSFLVQLYLTHPYLIAVPIAVLVVMAHFVYRTCSRPTVADLKADSESFAAPVHEHHPLIDRRKNLVPIVRPSENSPSPGLKSPGLNSNTMALNRPIELRTRRESILGGLKIANELETHRKPVLTSVKEVGPSSCNDEDSDAQEEWLQYRARHQSRLTGIVKLEVSDCSSIEDVSEEDTISEDCSVDNFDVGEEWLDERPRRASRALGINALNIEVSDNSSDSEMTGDGSALLDEEWLEARTRRDSRLPGAFELHVSDSLSVDGDVIDGAEEEENSIERPASNLVRNAYLTSPDKVGPYSNSIDIYASFCNEVYAIDSESDEQDI